MPSEASRVLEPTGDDGGASGRDLGDDGDSLERESKRDMTSSWVSPMRRSLAGSAGAAAWGSTAVTKWAAELSPSVGTMTLRRAWKSSQEFPHGNPAFVIETLFCKTLEKVKEGKK